MTSRLKISLVTPTLNSARYLPEMFSSIRAQTGTFRLQHVIIDGGSTDQTLDIIKNNASNLEYWESNPDEGMYDALSKGFERTDGELMGWLNSDDIYFPWALSTVSSIFSSLPEVEWISSLSPAVINSYQQIKKINHIPGFSSQAFIDGIYVGFDGLGNSYACDFIQQESTFWRRSLWERLGSDPLLHYRTSRRQAGDFGLWALFAANANLYGTATPLAGWRQHMGQFTEPDPYMREVTRSLEILRGGKEYSSPKPQDDFVEYIGNYIVPGDQNEWQTEKHPFYILRNSDVKMAIKQGTIS